MRIVDQSNDHRSGVDVYFLIAPPGGGGGGGRGGGGEGGGGEMPESTIVPVKHHAHWSAQ